MDKKNFIIAGLLVVVLVLLYLGKRSNAELAEKDTLLTAAKDTIHIFKTDLGNKGGYISTLEGTRNDLLEVLDLKKANRDLIDTVKKYKDIKSATVVNSTSTIRYEKQIDTVYRSLNFRDTVRTKWYDLDVTIANSKLGVNVNQRDELHLTNRLVPNKGLFTGSTLTTYATSKNPDVNITGVTSISTTVDKPKLHVAPAIGAGVNTDLKGQGMRLGFNAGLVITF